MAHSNKAPALVDNIMPIIGRTYITVSATVSILFSLLIFIILTLYSIPAVQKIGGQLFTLQWDPAHHLFGILPMLFGSLVTAGIALLLAVPLGICCAIFVSEKLSRHRLLCKSTLEILAGIPSIIYGLIGVALVAPWIAQYFSLSTGRTFLAAGGILAIMILPTIITLCDDALHNIPAHYRENAKGLGLYPYEIIFRVLLPMAWPDIIAVILLALGRTLGETMAVMLIIGGLDKLPDPIFNMLSPGQTITSKMGREITETAFDSLHFSALIAMGMTLMLIVLFFTYTAQRFSPQQHRLHE